MTEGMVKFSGAGNGGDGQPAPDLNSLPPQAAPENAQTGTSGATPDTNLSPDALRKLIGEEVANALLAAQKKSQSAMAKQEARIKQMVQDQLATLQAANVKVGTQEAQAIETHIREQVSQQDEPSEEGSAQETPEAKIDPKDVDRRAFAIQEAIGIYLEQTDPEARMVDRSSPDAFIASLTKALFVKQTRMSTNPAARMPTGGGVPSSGYVDDNLSGLDGLDLYFQSK